MIKLVNKRVGELVDEIDRLKKQDVDVIISYALDRQKLIEGLQFYANEDNWRGGLSYMSDVHIDHGTRAKRILKELGVTE